MAGTHAFEAEERTMTGTGAARAVRRAGRVPAVVFGGDDAPIHVTLPFNEVKKELNRGHLLTTVYDIKVGKKVVKAIPRDVQVDLLKDQPVHLDFQRVTAKTKIAVEIPVVFLNEEKSPGLKRGGVLSVVRREVELLCPAGAIPESIETDLDGLDIGDVIHISAFKLPDGVTPTITDRDFTVATISSPSKMSEPTTEVDESDDDDGEDDED